ncbi:hypothetical protein [Cyanobium gracile]|uniref:PEP-CTERM exosortase interaction domain-containing protein n=1 Tax=Cyanobium gracile (strain ATCC 27147 / PCC 6307) TaxID=292564 RepID=K9P5L0_CYAGP|nr:hypothetical protein [Cyanobium gracile]AFY28283.1 hypothetical protein Cyagr_1102 [Cyanobium gracile PCC 6307]
MTSLLPKLAFVTTGLALGMAVVQPAPIKAAVVDYTFDILIDSGPLTPNSYSGTFSYNSQTFGLTDFSFLFQGTQYDEGDDPNASVIFDNGVFLGLEYSVDTLPAFSFVPGFFDVSEAFFAYDLDAIGSQGGAGSLAFTRVVTPDTSAVPGPLPLLGAAACFGYSRRLRQRIQRTAAVPAPASKPD